MHQSHAKTSPGSPKKGFCLTEWYPRSPNSTYSWSHTGVPGLEQRELNPSSRCYQLRAKILLFWKEHSGLKRKKRSYTESVLNTWAPGPSHRDCFSEGSRHLDVFVRKQRKLKSKVWPRHTKRTYNCAALFLSFKYPAIMQCIPTTLILKVPKKNWDFAYL